MRPLEPATPAVWRKKTTLAPSARKQPKIYLKNFEFSKFSFHQGLLMSSKKRPVSTSQSLRSNVMSIGAQLWGGSGDSGVAFRAVVAEKFVLQFLCECQQRARLVEGFHFPWLVSHLTKETPHQILRDRGGSTRAKRCTSNRSPGPKAPTGGRGCLLGTVNLYTFFWQF